MIRVLALLVALALAAPLQAQVTITPASAVTGGGVVTSSQLLAPDGSAAAPAYSFANGSGTGFYRPGTDQIGISSAGYAPGPAALFSSAGLNLGSGYLLQWSSSNAANIANVDVSLSRDAANTLAQRNGVNAQTFRLYGSYTDATNYSRFQSRQISAATWELSTEKSGTGVLDNLKIGTTSATGTLVLASAGTDRWYVNPTGHFLAATDNTYDIGASGATRPRTIYAAGNFFGADTTAFVAGNLGYLAAAADGVWRFSNGAGTGFTRLILGTNDATSNGASFLLTGGNVALRQGDGGAAVSLEAARVDVYSSFNGLSATGTLVTNAAQTVANAGVISLGTGSTPSGMLVVQENEGGTSAIFFLNGSAQSTDLVASFGGAGLYYSVTKGTAAKINVYWDTVNLRYELQNNIGGSRSIRVVRLGV